MKFAAQFTILTAIVFTFVVATPMKGRQMSSSGLSTTPSLTRRDNGCSTKKICHLCKSSKLAQTEAECKAINSEQNTQQPDTKAADTAWNGMKTHVFGGGQKGTARTHLTKAWKAKDPKADFESNEATGLSRVKKPGHQYTEAEVEAMCKAAIALILKRNKSGTLPTGHTSTSVSVEAFDGTNICVTVQGNTNCFPMDIKPTSTPAGEECDAGGMGFRSSKTHHFLTPKLPSQTFTSGLKIQVCPKLSSSRLLVLGFYGGTSSCEDQEAAGKNIELVEESTLLRNENPCSLLLGLRLALSFPPLKYGSTRFASNGCAEPAPEHTPIFGLGWVVLLFIFAEGPIMSPEAELQNLDPVSSVVLGPKFETEESDDDKRGQPDSATALKTDSGTYALC
ncbi:hypothetical protein IW262DRAFT_1295629 [Armillaria fumosa]|nr:hypothetical protein IW262DRAFT_1295629 [Armillaria fumosa]